MMQKCYFGDMLAAYVAAGDTSTRRVDAFQFWQHDLAAWWWQQEKKKGLAKPPSP
jgi:hypothetical protein